MVFGQILEIVSCFPSSHFELASSLLCFLGFTLYASSIGRSYPATFAFTSTLFPRSAASSQSFQSSTIPSQLRRRGSTLSS